jgi:hypothetical protein
MADEGEGSSGLPDKPDSPEFAAAAVLRIVALLPKWQTGTKEPQAAVKGAAKPSCDTPSPRY